MTIGLGMRIETVGEFNRRAAIAMRAVEVNEPFMLDILAKLRQQQALTAAQQQYFIKAVHRYAKRITDTMVVEYAASHAREAD